MKCADVWAQVSEYLDRSLDAAQRRKIDAHVKSCPRCKSVLEGTRNAVSLVGDEQAFALPSHVSRRMYAKLDQHLQGHSSTSVEIVRDIPVGITQDRVSLGSHLIYFWENDDDFERGVRFLYPGIGQGEHCIAFGHDEALEKVRAILRNKGYDPEELVRRREITFLRRHANAQTTLSDISDVMQAAMRSGVKAIRFLGNLGMGRDPLPAGEDDVLELEAKASTLISGLPAVIVCMYDVRTLSGRLIMKGGLQSHHLTVCSEGVTKNPYYQPESDPHHHIHTVQ